MLAGRKCTYTWHASSVWQTGMEHQRSLRRPVRVIVTEMAVGSQELNPATLSSLPLADGSCLHGLRPRRTRGFLLSTLWVFWIPGRLGHPSSLKRAKGKGRCQRDLSLILGKHMPSWKSLRTSSLCPTAWNGVPRTSQTSSSKRGWGSFRA